MIIKRIIEHIVSAQLRPIQEELTSIKEELKVTQERWCTFERKLSEQEQFLIERSEEFSKKIKDSSSKLEFTTKDVSGFKSAYTESKVQVLVFLTSIKKALDELLK